MLSAVSPNLIIFFRPVFFAKYESFKFFISTTPLLSELYLWLSAVEPEPLYL